MPHKKSGKHFAQYRKPSQAALPPAEREEWRTRFATSLVEYAQTVASREALLEELHGILPSLGMQDGLVRLGSGSTRGVFALPFGLVLKMELSLSCFTSLRGKESIASGFVPLGSSNYAEADRAKRFPAFIPRVYGQCLRFFDAAEETISFIIAEQMIPLSQFLDSASDTFDTNAVNFGIDPVTGRVVLMDAGSAWSDGVEEELDAGTHPLLSFPFMSQPRRKA